MTVVMIGHGRSRLTIETAAASSSFGSDRFEVTLRGPGLSAVTSVHELVGSGRLSAFFDSLEADWRGWLGERVFESLEGDFRLVATHRRVIELGVRLDGGMGQTEAWTASGSVILDPGEELSRVARELR